MVSEADLSNHNIPINSLRACLHSNRQEQKQQHRSEQRGGNDASGSEADRDEFATIPEEMNLGKYPCKYQTKNISFIFHVQISSLHYWNITQSMYSSSTSLTMLQLRPMPLGSRITGLKLATGGPQQAQTVT